MLSARNNTHATTTDKNVRMNAAVFASGAKRGETVAPKLFQA
jgi:hypothetical protein